MMNRRMAICCLLAALTTGLAFAAGGSEATTAAPAGFNETGFPIVDPPVTITMVAPKHAASGDILQMDLWLKYQEMTNVIVDAEFVAPAAWNERRNLMLASGDVPDILGNTPDGDLVRYSQQGLFVPMDDLIERYAPHVRQLFVQRPNIERALRLPDGKIYSLPRINEFSFRENPDVMYINKAWLDRLGLAEPTTTAELEGVLRAFRDNDANGNGDRNDEIPMSFVFSDYNSAEPWSLLGMFGTLDNGSHTLIEGGQITFAPLMEEYREGMKWFARMYADGLIDQEVFTHNSREYSAKGTAGTHSTYGLAFEWFADMAVGPERAAAEYVTLAPLRGPKGHQMWNRYEDQAFAGKGWFVITASNKHPEVSMRWMDYIYEPTFSLEWSRGPIGVTVIQRPDGTYAFADPPAGTSAAAFRFGNAPGGGTGWAVLNDMYERIEIDTASARKLYEDWPLYKPYLVEEAWPALFFTIEEGERLATLQIDINNYITQMRARWIVGELDIDATWNEFRDRLYRMGLEEMLRIMQTALDRHNSAG